MQDSKNFFQGFLLMLLPAGLVWLRSGFGKIIDGKFPLMLEGTLRKFIVKNPYPFYKSFLENTIIPNAKSFGMFIMWTEVFVAFSTIFSVVYLLTQKQRNKFVELLLTAGLILGILLNANFWLAASWTGQSTDGLNLIMIMLQAIGLVFVIKYFKKPQKAKK